MILFYILLIVYILAINFYSYRLIKTQRDDWEAGGDSFSKQDGKLMLAAVLGGASAIYIAMFAMRFRLSNILLMTALPVLAVLNLYCFFLGFRGIYLFI